LWYSNTQNGAAIFSLRTLASPSGRNVNYDEKQRTREKFFFICYFYLHRFRKYVSYSSPIINFCNPGCGESLELSISLTGRGTSVSVSNKAWWRSVHFVSCFVLEIPPHFGAEIREAARKRLLQWTTFARRHTKGHRNLQTTSGNAGKRNTS
jgi:hypothetical protein